MDTNPTPPTTAEEVREAEARTEADRLKAHLDQVDFSTNSAEKDPGLAAEAMTDQELADYVAAIQDIRQRLTMVERDLTTALGQRLGKTVGALGDGRQYKLERSQDRKEWAHDDWKRDVRRTVAKRTMDMAAEEYPEGLVNPATGEAVELGPILAVAIHDAQEVHGAQSPKSTALKALGLYASDYCTSTPAGWRFSAVKPTTPTTEDSTNA